MYRLLLPTPFTLHANVARQQEVGHAADGPFLDDDVAWVELLEVKALGTAIATGGEGCRESFRAGGEERGAKGGGCRE